MPTIDMLNRTFERLTVISEAPRGRHRERRWVCQCSCGNQTVVPGALLRKKNTRSCGCLNKEKITRHGGYANRKETPECRSWHRMMQRCTNPRNKSWAYYGGPGITVIERWHDFVNFLADMGPRPPLHSLERLDNNGPYSPENCIWATATVQMCNRRNNVLLTIGVRTMPVTAWAKEHGMPRNSLFNRIKAGWPTEHLFVPPLRGRQKRPR